MKVVLYDVNDYLYWGLSGYLILLPCILISFFLPKRQYYQARMLSFIFLTVSFIFGMEYLGHVYINERWLTMLLQFFSIAVFPVCNTCTLREIVYMKIWGMAFSGLQAQVPGLMAAAVSPGNILSLLPVCKVISAVIIYGALLLIFRHLKERGLLEMTWREIILAGIITLVVTLFNSGLFRFYEGGINDSGGIMIFLMQAFSMLCVLLALYMQQEIHYRRVVQSDRDLRERIWNLEKKHFEERQEQIDLINRKCHDLKHQIAALEHISDREVYDRNIREIKEAVQMYDDSLNTGNSALESILMERKLQFGERGVLLHCVVDGKSIDFIDTVDLYILLGNVLDNALESVLLLPDQVEKKVEVRIFRDRNMIRMIFRNPFAGELQLREGMPVSTKVKDGYHGFGLPSVRQIVRKYEGDLSIKTEEQEFVLKIMIPLPAAGNR